MPSSMVTTLLFNILYSFSFTSRIHVMALLYRSNIVDSNFWHLIIDNEFSKN